MAPLAPSKIPDEELGELWFAFNHNILEQLQSRAHEMGAAGETQKLIAKRLGKDPASINRWLRGRSNMTIRTMHDLARAMSCRLRVELQRLDKLAPANANPSPWRLPNEPVLEERPKLASMATAAQSPEGKNLAAWQPMAVYEMRTRADVGSSTPTQRPPLASLREERVRERTN